MRGQLLTLPAGEAMRQRIGYESNELDDGENLYVCFGISTLSSIQYEISYFRLAAAILRFRSRSKSGHRRLLMSVLYQCFGID
jgi:hypothetical protein